MYEKGKKEEEKKKEEKAKKDAEKKKSEPSKVVEEEETRKKIQKAKEEEDARKKAEALKAAEQKVKEAEAAKSGKEENGEKKEEESKAPPGNGGITDRYVWTQTLTDLHVVIPVEDKVTKKELTISIEESGLKVQIKGQPKPIIEGAWPEKIDIDDCLWTLVGDKGKKVINIEIAKFKTYQGWWNCVVKGEPTIDTSKVNPEPSKLSDLDGEMRGQVEKMMFDMRQKQKGEPSSDELLKRDKLKDFMKAHPEMDFSKAKFN